jgi:hypothetical protein
MPFRAWNLERFRAKWEPVRVKKTRQTKRQSPGSDSIRTGKALENQRSQLVERVDRLEAHQNERYDHQIKAKMHEGVATKCFLPCARIAQGREPNSGRVERAIARRTSRRQLEQKASAAAEVMPSSRTSSVGGLLFDASSLFVYVP